MSMKTKFDVLALLITILLLNSSAYGATDDILDGMGKKLYRGLSNVFTGWLEVPYQTVKCYNNAYYEYEGNPVISGIGGFFKGICYAVGRTASGVFEVAGFWTANPEDNWRAGIPLEAKHPWEEGYSYDFYDPNFAKATLEPMGNKLVRGFKNTLFGFAELPGQVMKGMGKKGGYFFGKGIWFALSREICGIADLTTVIFPGPEENMGYPFEEENPWDALIGSVRE